MRDRRVKLVQSTKPGQELPARAVPAWRAARSALDGTFDPEVLGQLQGALERL